MIGELLAVLGAGLSLWNHKEKTKYQDRFIQLKRDLYEEQNKPADRRSDARLDELTFELRLLAGSFAASAGKPDAADQS